MSEKRRVFEDFAADYDRWFDDHGEVYPAQLRLLGRAVPSPGLGLEIGVGAGRFAAPLGIRCGIDPSFPLQKWQSAEVLRLPSGSVSTCRTDRDRLIIS